MKRLKNNIPNLVIIGLLAILILSRSDTNAPETPDPVTHTVDQRIIPPPLPATITFAGESVPLDDYDVKERMDRELLVNTYFHSSTIQAWKLSGRYFPVIEPILEKYGVPDDFKYLAVAESGLRNVVSPARAEGIWQIRATAARELGLEITREVDERYHIEKATEAACKYLLQLKQRFGSWAMAAAAYNVGPAALEKHIENQKVSSYFDLYLNEETSRYVFRILAIKTIFENPAKYGFVLHESDKYRPIPYKEVEVTESITSLAEFAKSHQTTYKAVKLLNPWLRYPGLTVQPGKKYIIKIPV